MAAVSILVPQAGSAGQQPGGGGLAIDGIPIRQCSPDSRTCLSHRTAFTIVDRDLRTATPDPYYPQELMDRVYGAVGFREDPLTCRVLGDGRTLSYRDVLVAPFVSFREAIASGLQLAEYEFFLSDEANYIVWLPTELRGRADRDPGGWLPERNRCWYLRRYLASKERWSLVIDIRERDAIQDVLDVCSWQALDPICDVQLTRARVVADVVPAPALETNRWRQACDGNVDGRVSCDEALACGALLPITLGDPLYPLVVDADEDGVACR